MTEPQNVLWSGILLEIGNLYMASTSKGVCYIALPNESFDTLQFWIQKHIPNSNLVYDPITHKPYEVQLTEYLEGARRDFAIPLDFYGTPFQQAVWNDLLSISYAQTKTYSTVSASIQKPNAVRAVGAAIGKNPIPIVVPCHRVVGTNGKLTGYRGGLDLKSKLLQLEHV